MNRIRKQTEHFSCCSFFVFISVPVDALVEDAPDVRLLDGSHSTDDDALAIPIDFLIDESGWNHGEVQPKACRDWFWAFLFLLQFAVVVTLAAFGIRNGVLSW